MASESNTATSREEATKDKVEAQFDKLSAEIDKLKAEAEEISADQRMKFYEYIETLDEKRDRLRSRLKDLRQASGSAMDEIEAGMKDAWQRVAIAKKAAEARFKRETQH